MELKRDERIKLVNNFKRFYEDIKAYDIVHDITIPLTITYSNKNNRYDYIKIYTNKQVFALGENFEEFIKNLEHELEQTWYCSYKYDKIIDIMNNRYTIFAELKEEDEKNRRALEDVLNY